MGISPSSALTPGVVCLAAALLCVASTAAAEELEATAAVERGQQLYLEADFEGARAAFEELLGSADVDRSDATEAHRYLAAVALIVGDEAAALRHARAAVALTPTVQSPEGAPPELAEALDGAREELGEDGARLTMTSDPEAVAVGSPAEITARLEPSLPGLAAALRIRCGGDDVPEVHAAGPPPTVSVTVAPSRGATAIQCSAGAETGAGAALLEVEASFPVQGSDAGGVLWWPWAVGAGGAALLAAVITVIVVVVTAPTDAIVDGPQVEGW